MGEAKTLKKKREGSGSEKKRERGEEGGGGIRARETWTLPVCPNRQAVRRRTRDISGRSIPEGDPIHTLMPNMGALEQNQVGKQSTIQWLGEMLAMALAKVS